MVVVGASRVKKTGIEIKPVHCAGSALVLEHNPVYLNSRLEPFLLLLRVLVVHTATYWIGLYIRNDELGHKRASSDSSALSLNLDTIFCYYES